MHDQTRLQSTDFAEIAPDTRTLHGALALIPLQELSQDITESALNVLNE